METRLRSGTRRDAAAPSAAEAAEQESGVRTRSQKRARGETLAADFPDVLPDQRRRRKDTQALPSAENQAASCLQGRAPAAAGHTRAQTVARGTGDLCTEQARTVADPQQPGTSIKPEPRTSQMDNSRQQRSRQNSKGDEKLEESGSGDDEQQERYSAEQALFGRHSRDALHGLLRKLGAGFEDIMPSGGMSSTQLKGILVQLRQEDNEVQQLDGLSQLCELLCVATEESLSIFPVEQLAPVLVSMLNAEHNPDIMLLAARALTFMADVMPSSCSAIIRCDAVPAFCARLLSIEYIDLAEQSLQALEKLAQEHPQSCLSNGGLMAVLTYLDFFQTGVQRVAVNTAASMCRGISRDATDTVVNAIPLLTPLLQYKDAKIVESACLALSRIAESLSHSPEHVDTLSKSGLVTNALQLIAVSDSGSITSQLSVSTYFGLIKLLTTCAISAPAVAETLLQNGISGILRNLLRSSSLLSTTSASPSAVLRSSDQLYEVVALACELLPALADSCLPLPAHELFNIPRSGASAAARERNAGSVKARAEFLEQHQDVMATYCSDLLPLLLVVYGGTVNPQVKSRCLITITKVVSYAQPDMLREQLRDVSISSFIASLLATKDGSTNVAAVRLSEMLMTKLPEVYSKYFLKEGVVHAMEQLALAAPPPAPEPAPEAAAQPPADAPPAVAAPPPAPAKKETRSSARLRPQSGKNKGSDPQPPKAAAAAGSSPPNQPPVAPEEAKKPPVKAPVPPTLRETAALRAKSFREQYFGGDARKTAADTDDARRLRAVCERLGKAGKVQELLSMLQGTAGCSISTFEFLSSGAVARLKAYLTGEDLKGDTKSHQLLQRLRSFVTVAGTMGVTPGGSGQTALLALVQKLQDSIAATESFPVQSSHIVPSHSALRFASSLHGYSGLRGLSSGQPASDASTLGQGLAALGQPFKLRLARAPHERQLREYNANVVLIEPLATMSAVEEFLYARVYREGPVSESPSNPAPVQAAAEAEREKAENNVATRSTQAAEASLKMGSPGNGQPPPAPTARGKRSQAQPIPAGKTTSSQRMTRAQAARVANELQEEAALQLADERKQGGAATQGGDAGKAGNGSAPPEGTNGVGRASTGESADLMEVDELVMLPGGGSLGADEEMQDAEHAEGEQLAYEEEIEDEDEDQDEDEDDDEQEADLPSAEHMSVGSMEVHDMLLAADGGAAAAQPAPTPDPSAARAATIAERATYAQAATRGRGASTDASAAASGAAAAADGPRLRFYSNNHLLQPSSTIFQAVQDRSDATATAGTTSAAASGETAPRRRRLWDEVHTLHYSRVDNVTSSAAAAAAASSPDAKALSAAAGGAVHAAPADATPLSELTHVALSGRMQAAQPCADLLLLVKLLDSLRRLSDHMAASLNLQQGLYERAVLPCELPTEALVNAKLASKLAQQLKDVLAICGGNLPPWTHALATTCRCLFPFELRRRFFYCTSFGMGRALHHLQAQQTAEGGAPPPSPTHHRELRVGRLQRQKVRVSRNRILDSATKVMELYASSRAVLELEYFGEVGTGLGPTLEFYTLLSHELQKKGLGMWRADATCNSAAKPLVRAEAKQEGAAIWPVPRVLRQGSAGDLAKPEQFVTAPQGLFPAPLSPSQIAASSKVLDRFKLLGRSMAKALQDGRLLDMPLSYTFYRIALGEPVDLQDVRKVDAGLGASLARLKAAHYAWQRAGKHDTPLFIDGAPIEDLCLTFVLPGFPDYELKPGGTDIAVDAANVEEYVDAVVEAMLHGGIQHQMAAFREGFNNVFPLETLKCFYEEELETLLCGTCESWTVEMLADIIKFDHGYTSGSTAVQHFLETLTELDSADQRRFLRFVTGSPSLPPGGVAALQPRLTVVRKQSSASMDMSSTPRASSTPRSLSHQPSFGSVDGDLPSVMTCANYIKLPPYSSKAVMQERVLFAIREGQGSFDLS